MKKTILVVALCVASSATWAATLCGATTPGQGTAHAVVANMFVKVTFTPKCSANTKVAFVESANTAAVGAISTKGNQIFSGHSNGGSVGLPATNNTCGLTSATPCAEGDATTAAANALTASSS